MDLDRILNNFGGLGAFLGRIGRLWSNLGRILVTKDAKKMFSDDKNAKMSEKWANMRLQDSASSQQPGEPRQRGRVGKG